MREQCRREGDSSGSDMYAWPLHSYPFGTVQTCMVSSTNSQRRTVKAGALGADQNSSDLGRRLTPACMLVCPRHGHGGEDRGGLHASICRAARVKKKNLVTE